MTQVSELLRRSPDFEPPYNPPAVRGDHPTVYREPVSFSLRTAAAKLNYVQETPTHNRVAAIRGGSVTPGPLSPSKSIDTDALRDALKRMTDLESLPDDVDKLQRKLKAAELGGQRKQDKIRDLEEELHR